MKAAVPGGPGTEPADEGVVSLDVVDLSDEDLEHVLGGLARAVVPDPGALENRPEPPPAVPQ